MCSLVVDENDYAASIFGGPRSVGHPHPNITYSPNPIPRTLTISDSSTRRLGDAEAALGRLAGVGRLLPDPDLLIVPYVRLAPEILAILNED